MPPQWKSRAGLLSNPHPEVRVFRDWAAASFHRLHTSLTLEVRAVLAGLASVPDGAGPPQGERSIPANMREANCLAELEMAYPFQIGRILRLILTRSGPKGKISR